MNTIIIEEREEKQALITRERVGMFKLASVMGPAYIKIQAAAKACGTTLDCAPFTSYVVEDWAKTTSMGFFGMLRSAFTQKWELEMGFESACAVPTETGIESIVIPGGRYVKTMHYGPYHKVGDTYKKVYAFALKEGVTLGGKSYEFYLNDPREVKPAEYKTEVLVPIL